MPQSATKTATAAWTQATDADVTSFTLHNKSPFYLEVSPAVGAVTPTDDDDVFLVPPYGVILNENMTDLWPGITGANRVYVKGNGQYLISHV